MVDIHEDSRTDMDAHANMPVIGRNACTLAEMGKTVEVRPFSPDCPAMVVPIVDAALQHDCPCDGKNCILVTRNALSVPSC